MPDQTASTPQQPATLIDYLMTKSKGYNFDDPNQKAMDYTDTGAKPLKSLPTFDLTAGKFGTSDQQFASAERLGNQIIGMAKKDNVDLSKFPEVKAAMGYDQDASKLTGAELGAFMMSYAASQNESQKQTLGQKVEMALNHIDESVSVNGDSQNGLFVGPAAVRQQVRQDVVQANSRDANIESKAHLVAKPAATAFNPDESPELMAFVGALGQQIYGSHSPSTASVAGMQASQQVLNPSKPQ